MRIHQKFSWTRRELRVYNNYLTTEYQLYCIAEDYMPYGVTVGSRVHKELEELGNELENIRTELKELMGTTRFDILMNDRFTAKAWENEIKARYIAKHPEFEPADCCPGWE